LIYGFDAADTITGGAGNDTINAEEGSDIITGGSGDDVLYGGTGSGNDTFIYARGDGNDTVVEWQNSGTADKLVLQDVDPAAVSLLRNGNDVTLVIAESEPGAGDGGSILLVANLEEWYSRGIDQILFDDGTTWTRADLRNLLLAQEVTEGDDTIIGFSYADYIDAKGGNDIITAGSGNDTLYGGDGNDVLYGGDSNDLLFGGEGDDLLRGDAGTDLIDGGAGNDTADFSLVTGALVVDLVAGTANTETLTSIENVVAGAGNDSLVGNGEANRLEGGSGADTLLGGVGADTLVGGTGGDTFVYTDILDAGDLIDGFDADSSDNINLDALLDGLSIADADRAGRIEVQQVGPDQDALISVDTTGDAVFDTIVATVTNVTGVLDQNDLNLGALV
uniref:calcium-binding protein n=1 Tax=Pelagibius sp. 7325 TaxID=3131994 RepID=UPI0030EE1F56